MTVSRTICLGFLTLIAIGSALLMLPISVASGEWNDAVTALFTSTSAVCVTGLIVVDTGSYYSGFGEAVILLLIQVGGLGYMTATTFLLLILGRRFGLREKLAIQKSLDVAEISGAVQLVRSIISLTLLFEVVGMLLLFPVFAGDYGDGYSLWLAVFHSISAFNNAGFSLFEDSLVGYATSPGVTFTITALIIIGGVGYQTLMELYQLLRSRLRGKRTCISLSLNFKIVTSTTLFLLVVGTLAFLLIEYRNPETLGPLNPLNKLMVSWFHAVMPRTAGFNSVDYGQMTTAALFLTIALMYVGASPGSTGGGIKTTTLRILLSSTVAVLQSKEEVLCYRRQIPMTLIIKAVGVVFGSGVTVIIVTTLIAFTNPDIPFIGLLFESVSAFATVGLSTGITASLSTAGKIILIGTMYIGRVGVLLMMSAILGDAKPSVINYPEENLLVG
ncbi:MAG: TrkH family potassium uptake protein [Cyanobacteria bacterium P01_A01_bin.135]